MTTLLQGRCPPPSRAGVFAYFPAASTGKRTSNWGSSGDSSSCGSSSRFGHLLSQLSKGQTTRQQHSTSQPLVDCSRQCGPSAPLPPVAVLCNAIKQQGIVGLQTTRQAHGHRRYPQPCFLQPTAAPIPVTHHQHSMELMQPGIAVPSKLSLQLTPRNTPAPANLLPARLDQHCAASQAVSPTPQHQQQQSPSPPPSNARRRPLPQQRSPLCLPILQAPVGSSTKPSQASTCTLKPCRLPSASPSPLNARLQRQAAHVPKSLHPAPQAQSRTQQHKAATQQVDAARQLIITPLPSQSSYTSTPASLSHTLPPPCSPYRLRPCPASPHTPAESHYQIAHATTPAHATTSCVVHTSIPAVSQPPHPASPSAQTRPLLCRHLQTLGLITRLRATLRVERARARINAAAARLHSVPNTATNET